MAINTSFVRAVTLAETTPAPFRAMMWLAVRIVELINASRHRPEAVSVKEAIPSTPPAGVTPRRVRRRTAPGPSTTWRGSSPGGNATVDPPPRC